MTEKERSDERDRSLACRGPRGANGQEKSSSAVGMSRTFSSDCGSVLQSDHSRWFLFGQRQQRYGFLLLLLLPLILRAAGTSIALHFVFLVLRVSAVLLLRMLMSDAREGARCYLHWYANFFEIFLPMCTMICTWETVRMYLSIRKSGVFLLL